MQSRISPDNCQKVSDLGIYQSILNPAVLDICKIDISPSSKVAVPILRLCIPFLSLKNG